MPPFGAIGPGFVDIESTVYAPPPSAQEQREHPSALVATCALMSQHACHLPNELVHIVLQYLRPFLARRVRTFRGHSGPVLCLAVLKRLLFSGSDDTTVRVWDSTGSCLRVLSEHRGAVRCMVTWRHRVLSGSADGTVRVWDCKGSPAQALISGHGPVLCMATLSQKLFTGTVGGTIRMWSRHGELLKSMDGHRGTVWCMASFKGRLFSGSTDGAIRMWTEEGQPLKELPGHRETVCAIVGLNNVLCTLSIGSTLRTWNADGEFCTEITCGRDRCVTQLSGRLVSGSVDRTLQLWDVGDADLSRTSPTDRSASAVRRQRLIKQVKAHEGPVLCVAGVGRHLFSGAEDGTIALWT
eukprot:EG_transcript_3905